MSKEILEQLGEVSRHLEEQLKFYREIGITDIAGSSRASERMTAAASGIEQPQAVSQTVARPVEPEPSPDDHRPKDEFAMPKKKEPSEQVNLFGEVVSASSQSASLPVIESNDSSLEAIREDIGECTRCKLHEHRTNIVFGEGSPQAKLVFVGEGPGADEDVTGRPFVGRAGQLLDKIIEALGLRREDVYICNVVKCRPPGNRTPERDETDTCEQFLFRQIAFIRPSVIVALGSPAFQCLLRTKETITRSRGQWREWKGIKVMPTFHPAYLLRVPAKKREAWEDMKQVRDYLNSLPD